MASHFDAMKLMLLRQCICQDFLRKAEELIEDVRPPFPSITGYESPFASDSIMQR